jgi:hypothetical protein
MATHEAGLPKATEDAAPPKAAERQKARQKHKPRPGQGASCKTVALVVPEHEVIHTAPVSRGTKGGNKFTGLTYGSGELDSPLYRRRHFSIKPGTSFCGLDLDVISSVTRIEQSARGVDIHVKFQNFPNENHKVEHYDLRKFINGPVAFYHFIWGLTPIKRQSIIGNIRMFDFAMAMLIRGRDGWANQHPDLARVWQVSWFDAT